MAMNALGRCAGSLGEAQIAPACLATIGNQGTIRRQDCDIGRTLGHGQLVDGRKAGPHDRATSAAKPITPHRPHTIVQ